MNLLFFSDVSIHDVIGGAERVLFEQTTRLAERGHRVYVITRRMARQLQPFQTVKGVHEVGCAFDPRHPMRLWFETWPEVRGRFAQLHKQIGFDCINIHQPTTAYAALRAAARHNLPIVYTCHSLSFEEFFSRHPVRKLWFRPMRWLNAMARRWVEQAVLRRSWRIVALSEYTVEKLYHAYSIPRERVEVIPGGVDLAKFHAGANKVGLRSRLGLPADAFTLLSVRNLEPRMGLDRLVAAMRVVVSRIPGAYLVIGGEGALQQGLSALAERLALGSHIRFCGFIQEKDLAEYYQAADLFVLPSQDLEGFGMVTLEAMACGLPVIGTPVGGTREILGGFDPHYLLRGCSVEALAEGILAHYEQISTAPQRALEVSRECRRYVEDRYSWDQNIAALERLFHRAAHGRSARSVPTPAAARCH
jgi:glycosyltransferase involved in cell wall biosynthesis